LIIALLGLKVKSLLCLKKVKSDPLLPAPQNALEGGFGAFIRPVTFLFKKSLDE
jgi:hypothetical protein